MDEMEGHDFEYYCAGILKKNGFENVEVTKGSGITTTGWWACDHEPVLYAACYRPGRKA